jgi:hypothetical protein
MMSKAVSVIGLVQTCTALSGAGRAQGMIQLSVVTLCSKRRSREFSQVCSIFFFSYLFRMGRAIIYLIMSRWQSVTTESAFLGAPPPSPSPSSPSSFKAVACVLSLDLP